MCRVCVSGASGVSGTVWGIRRVLSGQEGGNWVSGSVWCSGVLHVRFLTCCLCAHCLERVQLPILANVDASCQLLLLVLLSGCSDALRIVNRNLPFDLRLLCLCLYSVRALS